MPLVVMRHGRGMARADGRAGSGTAERLDLMGWMAPYRHLCAKWWLSKVTNRGAIQDADYNNWS